jgi:hypothetical protein
MGWEVPASIQFPSGTGQENSILEYNLWPSKLSKLNLDAFKYRLNQTACN